MNDVLSFQGPHRFLSNFWPAPVRYGGILFPTTEHAYQAAKSDDVNEAIRVSLLKTPGDAKRVGRTLVVRENWEQIKRPIMLDVLRLKFNLPDLRRKLLATGDVLLVEGNTWGDRYWGVCNGVGENWLGRLLMQVREECRQ
jgi:ribA/ribD-fused uncharacterized protein